MLLTLLPCTVFQFSCQCHILNLLAQDLSKDKGRSQVLEHVIKTPAATLVTNRAEQLLKYPPALLAYALDPSSSTLSPLPPMRLMIARQFVVEKGSEQIVSQFDMYLSRTGVFAGMGVQSNPNNANWWKAGIKCGLPTAISSLAINLSACRAASADIERNFSTLSHVYGKRRNSLSTQKAFQLAFLFRRLNKKPLTGDEDQDSD